MLKGVVRQFRNRPESGFLGSIQVRVVRIRGDRRASTLDSIVTVYLRGENSRGDLRFVR